MGFNQKAVLKGVVARLKAVTAVTSIVGQRIYTNVPINPSFPYLAVSISSAQNDHKDATRQIHSIDIQSYSRDSSIEQTLSIHEALFDALSRQEGNITLDEGTVTMCMFDRCLGGIKDSDGVTWLQVSLFDLWSE